MESISNSTFGLNSGAVFFMGVRESSLFEDPVSFSACFGWTESGEGLAFGLGGGAVGLGLVGGFDGLVGGAGGVVL